MAYPRVWSLLPWYSFCIPQTYQGFWVHWVSHSTNMLMTQAYLNGPAAVASSMVERILEASDALDRWMSSNRLRLNQDKTQHICLGTRAQLSKIDFDSLCFRFPNVNFSSSVHGLGFILDPALSLSDHVNSVSSSCFYYLRQLRSIRQSLPHDCML